MAAASLCNSCSHTRTAPIDMLLYMLMLSYIGERLIDGGEWWSGREIDFSAFGVFPATYVEISEWGFSV